MSRLIVLVLVVCYLLATATSNFNQMKTNPNRAVRLCGINVDHVLDLVCQGSFTQPAKKKSFPRVIGFENEDSSDNFDDYLRNWPYPVKSKSLASALLPRRFRRQTVGISDECCHKPCTYNELTEYCG